MIIVFAPVFAWLWTRLARAGQEPSGPGKFSLGLLGVGLGFVVLWWAARLSGPEGHLVAPHWLLTVFLFHTWGELCLSPVGLSLMTKLARARIASFVMGLWFTSTALGNGLCGWIASFYETEGGAAPSHLFGGIAVYCLIAAFILALLVRPIKKSTAAAE